MTDTEISGTSAAPAAEPVATTAAPAAAQASPPSPGAPFEQMSEAQFNDAMQRLASAAGEQTLRELRMRNVLGVVRELVGGA